jgi:hypothetical protein
MMATAAISFNGDDTRSLMGGKWKTPAEENHTAGVSHIMQDETFSEDYNETISPQTKLKSAASTRRA